jgi:hypothetical protein
LHFTPDDTTRIQQRSSDTSSPAGLPVVPSLVAIPMELSELQLSYLTRTVGCIFKKVSGKHGFVQIRETKNKDLHYSSRQHLIDRVSLILFIKDLVVNSQQDNVIHAIIDSEVLNRFHFTFHRAFAVDNYLLPEAFLNTIGCGFCGWRMTDQSEQRVLHGVTNKRELIAHDVALTRSRIVEIIEEYISNINYQSTFQQLLAETKLKSAIFYATNFPDRQNPEMCYADAAYMRFLPFRFMLFQFVSNNHELFTIGAKTYCWTHLTILSQCVFDKFFTTAPHLTYHQMCDLCMSPEYNGHYPGHFFFLENPDDPMVEINSLSASLEDWLAPVIAMVNVLTDDDLISFRIFASTVRSGPFTPPPPPPEAPDDIITASGDILVDLDVNEDRQYPDLRRANGQICSPVRIDKPCLKDLDTHAEDRFKLDKNDIELTVNLYIYIYIVLVLIFLLVL